METRTFTADELKAYSDTIAKAEREACAKIADNLRLEMFGYSERADADQIAAAIQRRTTARN